MRKILTRICSWIFRQAMDDYFAREVLMNYLADSYRFGIIVEDIASRDLDWEEECIAARAAERVIDNKITAIYSDILAEMVDDPDFTYVVDQAIQNKERHLDEFGYPNPAPFYGYPLY